MIKYSLISYLILAVVMIFVLNKFVGIGNQLEGKILGSYYSQMEEMNEATGMEIYNLEKRALTSEDLQALKELQ